MRKESSPKAGRIRHRSERHYSDGVNRIGKVTAMRLSWDYQRRSDVEEEE